MNLKKRMVTKFFFARLVAHCSGVIYRHHLPVQWGTSCLYREAPLTCKRRTTPICIQGGTTNLYWPTGKHHLPIQEAGRDNLTIQGDVPKQGGTKYTGRLYLPIQGGTNYMYLHKWAPQHRQVPHVYAGWYLSKKGHHLRYGGHYLPTQRCTTYLHRRAPICLVGWTATPTQSCTRRSCRRSWVCKSHW
jgi:hypothetical protein